MTLRVSEAGLDVALGVLPMIPEFDPDDGEHGTWGESAAERLENREHLILVAQSTLIRDPAGMLIAYDRYADGSLYCWLTGVIPAARRQGALSALMTAMKERAREQGYEGIRIGTQNRFRGMLAYLVRDGYAFLEVSPQEYVMHNKISLVRDLPSR